MEKEESLCVWANELNGCDVPIEKKTIFHVFKAANVWYLSELWWVLAAFYTHWSFIVCSLFNVHLYTDRLHYGYCWNDVLVLVVSRVSRASIHTIHKHIDLTRLGSIRFKQTNIYFNTHREKENKESVSDECQELEISKQWLLNCRESACTHILLLLVLVFATNFYT